VEGEILNKKCADCTSKLIILKKKQAQAMVLKKDLMRIYEATT